MTYKMIEFCIFVYVLYYRLKHIFGDSDRDVERNDLAEMIYLGAVLKESMRYYVTAPFVARYLDKEVKLSNIFFDYSIFTISIWLWQNRESDYEICYNILNLEWDIPVKCYSK